MTELRLNLASDINRACEQANDKADEAIGFAKLAGTLLLEAKTALPHGDWLPWLEANIWVTPRQAQRYMQVAQGRPLPIRAVPRVSIFKPFEDAPTPKTTPVSHLEVDAPRLFPGGPDAAEFVPEAGYCTTIYAVEPSLKHPGYFFVSKMDAATDMVDYTRRPVSAGWVEVNLQYYGLENPSAAEWRTLPSAGVLEALDTFPGCAA